MLTKLRVHNFRNFDDRVFEFSANTTVIVGSNAVGKTNILEAVFLLATGKSFKARVETEMIQETEEIGRVKGKVKGFDGETILEVVLTHGLVGDPSGVQKASPRKRLLVNDVGKRLVDFAAQFTVVLFRPEDMELVTGSPSIRRGFLDTLLSQVDREYRRSLLSYEKGLRQRNKLLLAIRDENMPRGSLMFWDKLLIKNGDYIAQQRTEFIEFLNSYEWVGQEQFQIEYDKSAISEARLAQYANQEVSAGTTLVGPHRDDINFLIFRPKADKQSSSPMGLAWFGSRGQQRMGVLWAKLAELSFIEKVTDEKPTLLLDDIFSELDHEHRELVFKSAQGMQTIITTADPHFVIDLEGVEKIQL